jgi:thiol-disulfide isomerase/thioredoxin
VLGGNGAVLTGQVVATGRDEAPLDRNWSLNYLISRDRGVMPPYPAGFPNLSFEPSEPMQLSWSLDPHFSDWVATRENHFVKLTPNGDLRVTGVAPGEYDLVICLYEQPAGCLVETVGEGIVPVHVDSEGEIDLGRIEVPCRAGPRVGSDMRAFEFVDTTGRKQAVNDMDGRFVLMHVWASWCAPCLESMPDMLETANKMVAQPVTFVGLNIDQDSTQATKLVEQQGWSWSQNYLGDNSEMSRQLAISSVPTYFLIGPDGLLAASSTEWTKIKKELNSLPRQQNL